MGDAAGLQFPLLVVAALLFEEQAAAASARSASVETTTRRYRWINGEPPFGRTERDLWIRSPVVRSTERLTARAPAVRSPGPANGHTRPPTVIGQPSAR